MKVEQKQHMDLRKRKCLAVVEKVCSFFIILLIAMQLVLAGITIFDQMNDLDSDCTGD